MRTVRIQGGKSATPGGAPGYDDDKELGNNIAHRAARTSQRLREHSGHTGKVKPSRRESACLGSLAPFPAFGEGNLLRTRKKARWRLLDPHREERRKARPEP